MSAGQIGRWNFVAAQIANDIAREHGETDNFIDVQAMALQQMGGELLPSHEWADWDAACADAATRLSGSQD